MSKEEIKKDLSRRKFITMTAGAASLALIPFDISSAYLAGAGQGKPDSKFGGVQIGAITYSWRSMSPTAEDTLKYCIDCGISSIELMSNTIELYAGIPQAPPRLPREAGEEQRAAYQKASAEVREKQRHWRTTVAMTRFEELRKMYKKAGVKIHIAKFSPESWSDEEIEYAFRAAKALGAKGVSTEIGEKACEKLGPVAEKHGMYAIMHQHLQPGQPGWTFEKFLAYSPAIMLNFDAGHYFGATGLHPGELIERLHDRIFTVHMKDKTGPKGNPPNTNMEWGKGETPIKDILLLLQKNRWPIGVDIELEYPVPEGSDAVKEVKKCVEYCRNILT
ncbi:MAG TPA: sugar phosphate isomerase/epimerase [Bacteroidales bacterium]|nr:sugar phosphate isomerase/epimerase [Bacteroidales bacterium]HPF03690.1 sugar phosphate isomerase/epimerase [Bacteroidales bacterium]HPJ60285.1 sugar phosphate isomerase/epimerase [Bacteroidales bacterium]HPR13152.1 sugar phosphate isomerase/epimerase [Bacteroidales bacterium]HRW85040.1 sugar phosphate isomerase/epimerase [Bacteroidales bacterium]